MSSYKILVNGEEQASVQSEKGDRVVLTFSREDGNTTSHTLEPEVMSDYPYVTLDVERAEDVAGSPPAEGEGGTTPDATADEGGGQGGETAADSQAGSPSEEEEETA